MKLFGKILFWSGVTVGIGPIAAFFGAVALAEAFPRLISESAMLGLHYLSAFGIIIYVPLSISLICVGKYMINLRTKDRKSGLPL